MYVCLRMIWDTWSQDALVSHSRCGPRCEDAARLPAGDGNPGEPRLGTVTLPTKLHDANQLLFREPMPLVRLEG